MTKPTQSGDVVAITRYIVQNTWDEEDDQELRDYLERLTRDDATVSLVYMSETEILQQAPLSQDTMLFCDSSIVQQILPNSHSVVVDTYPKELEGLYRRKIARVASLECQQHALPYFIKLAGSNKQFAARVIRTVEEEQLAKTAMGADNKTSVYVCEVVDFCAEFRLLIGRGKLWAPPIEYSEYMIGHRLVNSDPDRAQLLEVKEIESPPDSFVQTVLHSVPEGKFWVVDIGLTSKDEWCVVECNPPFALSSYDLDMEAYVQYCVAAWQQILETDGKE